MSAQSVRLSRAIQEVERARREHHRCLDVRDLITAGILKPHGHSDLTYVQAAKALEAAEAEALRLHALAVGHGQVLVGGTLAEPHATCGPYARFDPGGGNWIGRRAGDRLGVPTYELISEDDPCWRDGATVTETWSAITAREKQRE
jgi:hypothetical protein